MALEVRGDIPFEVRHNDDIDAALDELGRYVKEALLTAEGKPWTLTLGFAAKRD